MATTYIHTYEQPYYAYTYVRQLSHNLKTEFSQQDFDGQMPFQ